MLAGLVVNEVVSTHHSIWTTVCCCVWPRASLWLHRPIAERRGDSGPILLARILVPIVKPWNWILSAIHPLSWYTDGTSDCSHQPPQQKPCIERVFERTKAVRKTMSHMGESKRQRERVCIAQTIWIGDSKGWKKFYLLEQSDNLEKEAKTCMFESSLQCSEGLLDRIHQLVNGQSTGHAYCLVDSGEYQANDAISCVLVKKEGGSGSWQRHGLFYCWETDMSIHQAHRAQGTGKD